MLDYILFEGVCFVLSYSICGRYLFAPLTGNKEGCNGLMVLRVRPKPTRFPINSLYTPLDNTLLHYYSFITDVKAKS